MLRIYGIAFRCASCGSSSTTTTTGRLLFCRNAAPARRTTARVAAGSVRFLRHVSRTEYRPLEIPGRCPVGTFPSEDVENCSGRRCTVNVNYRQKFCANSPGHFERKIPVKMKMVEAMIVFFSFFFFNGRRRLLKLSPVTRNWLFMRSGMGAKRTAQCRCDMNNVLLIFKLYKYAVRDNLNIVKGALFILHFVSRLKSCYSLDVYTLEFSS